MSIILTVTMETQFNPVLLDILVLDGARIVASRSIVRPHEFVIGSANSTYEMGSDFMAPQYSFDKFFKIFRRGVIGEYYHILLVLSGVRFSLKRTKETV